jgi:hypothetical protein
MLERVERVEIGRLRPAEAHGRHGFMERLGAHGWPIG